MNYHTQLGAIFFWICSNRYIKQKDKDGLEINEPYLQLHRMAMYYAIIFHHHRGLLPNGILQQIIENGDGFRFQDLKEIVQKIKIQYSLFRSDKIQELARYFTATVNLPNFNINKIFYEIILSAIEELLSFFKIPDEDTIDDLELKDLIYDIENTWYLLNKSGNFFSIVLIYYSLLCDLDEWDAKSHIKNTAKHYFPFENINIELPNTLIKEYRAQKFKKILPSNPDILLQLKQKLWEASESLSLDSLPQIITVKYPTGSGKTLAYLNIAFKIRSLYKSRFNLIPKIIYCLPFISITDQVSEELTLILNQYLNANPESKLLLKLPVQSELIITHHHMAESKWSYLGIPETEEQYNFSQSKDNIYLWKSNIIITTFVSFWNNIFSGVKGSLLKFHRIAGSIIILDEIQNIPIRYWQLISGILHQLSKIFGCTFIIGSATNPKALSYSYDWNNPNNCSLTSIDIDYFKISLNRYDLIYNPDLISIDSFAETLIQQINSILKKFENKSVSSINTKKNREGNDMMIVLNTRRSARQLFDYLNQNCKNIPIRFLSSALTFADRREIIEELKSATYPIILVCTQVIEAGIDISFTNVYRDMAPLDSIIQVAGRCNRNNKFKGTITVINLVELSNNKPFSQIYDEILINKTHQILLQIPVPCSEKELLNCLEKYYDDLSLIGKQKRTNIGVDYFLQAQIESLACDFKLIEEDQNETLIIIEKVEKFENFIKNIEGNSLSISDILQNYRTHTIAISSEIRKKIFHHINDARYLKQLFNKETNDLPIWVICHENNEGIYQKNGGLSKELL